MRWNRRKSTPSATETNTSKQKRSLNLSPRTQKILLGISLVGFSIFGVWLLGSSLATTVPPSTTATPECGARVRNYSYRVPFGNAVWNQPVCNLPKYSQSNEYVSRFINWGHVNDGSPAADSRNGYISVDPGYPGPPTLFDPDGLSNLFTREVYYASKATTQTKIQTSVYDSNLDGADLPYRDAKRTLPDSSIPWNPNWKTGEAGDNEIVILDDRPGPTQGRIYGVSGYKRGAAAVTQCGPFLRQERICTYHVSVGRDLDGNYIDYRTYEGFLSERGVGLSYYATLTTPEEVAAGEIRHSLGISIPNTSYGPICTQQQLGTQAEGRTCGTAVAPASKFEWGGRSAPPIMKEPYLSLYTLDKTIPEGMRFAINVTDQEIDNWINSKESTRNNPRRAETARIFARALRDYGMMVVDTNGARPSVQMTGGVNPDSAQQWKDLGLGPEHKDDLLTGLVNEQNLYVVDPPTLTCIDGSTSKHYCKWRSAHYTPTATPGNTTPTPPANTPPTVSLGNLNTTYTAPASITLNATAASSSGITKVEFYNGNTKLGEDTSAPYSFRWNNIAEGNYTVTARVSDRNGATATSNSISFNVVSRNTGTTGQPDNPTTPGTPNTNQNTPPTRVSIPATVPVEIRFNWERFEFHQSIILSWGESVSSKGISKYVVNKNGKKIYEGPNRQFVDFAVNSDQRYKYEIYAVDKAGYASNPATYDRTFKCSWWGLVCRY